MEKIHQPSPGVTVFTLYGMAGGELKKHYLVLKAERKNPFLFLASHRIVVNAHPPAPVMRLRKYLSGQRVTAAFAAWTERKLYLQVTGLDDTWLCLDLREGPSLLFSPPPPYAEPGWPVNHEDGPSLEDLSRDEGWRNFPVLTPALRRTLPYLDDLDARALLLDLQAGGGDVFLYETEDKAGNPLREISAWPLPGAQLAHMKSGTGPWRESVWEEPLPALALAGESQVYSLVSSRARETASRPFSAEASRLAKLQKKLDREEERLLALTAKQENALLLQKNLYRFAQDEKWDHAQLEGTSGPVRMELDPRLTVRENMAAMFHQAGRGKRGLVHLEQRKRVVAEEYRRATEAMLHSQAASSGTFPAGGSASPGPAMRKTPAALPKQVQAFRSSDGFLLLRGRDTKGNGVALRLASPHDFWLHTAHGPSAHVIIRRDHAGHEVPERTLLEAGILAALKSHMKDDVRAEIQYSLAKYIHPMRGAGPGMVRIDRSEGTFLVTLDPALEDALKIG